ncbi:hypothetical protein DSM106972_084960 [Dulcicalothrix desertica PCC 7102]|uniref:DUF1802 domain-containing protein n=1 Tax=Dulcicalothrix desertica PCC 7102 TaxID=232991 RepID=A0A3S1AB06_9CYAN|nr:DUF1802 family protein [Dulcicalothrix desertica]RUS97393.1 hypothetical protein DSM106972_084960 [Dulcicalothrix desertica PCC 7102]TWH55570.1 restriction endonuclease [Dulcicalothrix desertica PCC 7102]
MSSSIIINTALCLPTPDIEALIQGRLITALPRMFLRPGQTFALYPIDTLAYDNYYRASFLHVANNVVTHQGVLLQPRQLSLVAQTEQLQLPLLVDETVQVKVWARCEFCEILDHTANLDILSRLTIWAKEALQAIIQQRQQIFLAYLRVYQLPQPQDVSANLGQKEKLGKFIGLPNSLTASEVNPVLNDNTFAIRKLQLEKRQPPLHQKLEELEGALTLITNPAAKQLQQDIQIFLGWRRPLQPASNDTDVTWIHKIASVGNSSDGHSFEKLVRKSLLKLGFTGSKLNPEGSGGAGGMDFYCEYPYPVVGECKATKLEKVPDSTPAQLLKIGINHLGKTQYERAVKLIVAAGELNSFAKRTATENDMNVITPETLQKLVALQANYKNSINLLELKECLQQAPFGIADEKVNKYIDIINQDIKLRAQLVQLVKKYLENTGYECASVDGLHGFVAGASIKIQPRELHEILVELASPLVGYLGRIKGEDWRHDRFYFLRDLLIS